MRSGDAWAGRSLAMFMRLTSAAAAAAAAAAARVHSLSPARRQVMQARPGPPADRRN